jgi:pyruvate/2-oxoglutarate/acetoin dehydrogenase E1 component
MPPFAPGADGAARLAAAGEASAPSTASIAKLSMCARWCRLDTQTHPGSVAKTHRLFTVEENPRLCGWGAEIVSIAADEGFYDLDGPPVRITTPHIPLPAADILKTLCCRHRPDRRARVAVLQG